MSKQEEEALLRSVEDRVKERASLVRTQLQALSKRIDVRGFRLVDGCVVWDVHIPPTLLTLLHQLSDLLSPPHAD